LFGFVPSRGKGFVWICPIKGEGTWLNSRSRGKGFGGNAPSGGKGFGGNPHQRERDLIETPPLNPLSL